LGIREEAVGKLKAALAARQDPSLVILASTRALSAVGIPEAIRRVRAYEKAGVDGIHLAPSETLEEIAAAAQFEDLMATCRDLDRQDRADRLIQLTLKQG